MWWPRPRWKCDLFTYCTLLLFVTITSTSNAVMADEGQHCGGANMSAVVWTTALCTMLLVLMVIAIYFIYCRRRENDWSSLWWKSNSDKNLVLQTSLPEKDLQQQKIGGTDNPAFLADTYVGERVTGTGLTKIVRLPQLTLNDGSLGIELSAKEDDDNQTYVCKHSDGSKGRLVALRLVFDKGQQQQQQQQQSGSPSDLSRALVELSRKYGLQVELETEGAASVPQPTVAGEKSDEAVKCAKPNLLSVVRGKAQRLWHQGQVVFKGGDRVDPDNKIGDGDLESAENGRAAAVASPTQRSSCTVTTVDETTTAVQQAAAPRNGNGSLRYRTLEYGASPADAAAHSSPDSSVQYCSVNVPDPVAVASVSAVMAAAAVTDVEVTATASDRDAIVTVSEKDATSTVPEPQDASESTSDKHVTVTASDADAVVGGGDDDDQISATKPKHTAPAKPNRDEPKYTAPAKPNRDEPKHTASAKPDRDEPERTAPTKPDRDEPERTAPTKPDRDEPKITTPEKPNPEKPKHTAANPPPPPPRKYSAPLAPAVEAVPRSTAAPVATVIATDTAETGALQRSPTALDASPALPTKAPPQTMSEIRMNDDYYWCTTTSMAPPPMLTFGKKPSVTGSAAETTNREGYAAAPGATVDEKSAAADEKSATVDEKNATVDEKSATVDEKNATVDEKNAAVVTVDDVVRDVIVSGGTTTSIEDASLPSFSSDEDEDDDENGVFADNKAQSPANTTDAVEPQNGSGGKSCNGEVSVSSGCKDVAVAKADCDAGPAAAELKSPTRLPTLRLSLSSPLSSTATTSYCSSSASSTSSTSTSSSPTNNGSSNNNSPIVSKIPVRRQSAGSSIGTAVISSPMAHGTVKKSIPLPLSRSGSRLAMWSSAN